MLNGDMHHSVHGEMKHLGFRNSQKDTEQESCTIQSLTASHTFSFAQGKQSCDATNKIRFPLYGRGIRGEGGMNWAHR